jgi:hypothetical protein
MWSRHSKTSGDIILFWHLAQRNSKAGKAILHEFDETEGLSTDSCVPYIDPTLRTFLTHFTMKDSKDDLFGKKCLK